MKNIVLLVCLILSGFVGGGCASVTTTRTSCGSKTRVVVGPEVNVWSGSGYYYTQYNDPPHNFGRGAYYGSDVHPNGSPFVPAIVLSEPPPMPPNVGWWVNQPVITGPSSTELELRIQRETKFEYFGEGSRSHSSHRRHGLQPPVAPNHPQPPVGPNPHHPPRQVGSEGTGGKPHGLQPQK